MKGTPRILYCNCSYKRIIPEDVKREVLAAVAASDVGFLAVPDVCEMVARRDGELRRLAEAESLIIVACYPRAVKWLFHLAGAPLEKANVEILNMRTDDADTIVARLPGKRPVSRETVSLPDVEKKGDWVPWFPAIDYDRCTGCRQCFSFCMFGVFAVSNDGRVVVENPRSCKDNCPACGRICPEAAIIFPKFTAPPVNGAEVEDEELERRRASALKKRIAEKDLHAILAERRSGLKARLAENRKRRAMEEREEHVPDSEPDGQVSSD